MRNPYSNAPDGWPDVNANGWPLWYQLRPDPTDPGWPPRSIPDDSKPVRIAYAGQTFADEAEIKAWRVRVENRDAALEQWRQQWEAQLYTGPYAVEDAERDPKAKWYLRAMALRYGDRVYYQALAGGNVAINALKNWAFYNSPPEGYDPLSYDGPLRAIVEGIVGEVAPPVSEQLTALGGGGETT